jgi:NAD(P)-dependent dehydrogenase (short-subunit alcohol dehydrogenase family)
VREGARVAITGRDRTRLESAAADMCGDALPFAVDVSDDTAMAEALAAAALAFGGLDVLFANVGGHIDATLGTTTRGAFEAALSRNVTSAFMTVQSALPHLHDGASIILTDSTYATMGPPGTSGYGGGKGAVASMARAMASELSPRRIRVNVVVPGATETPSWPFEKLDGETRRKHIKQLVSALR